MRRLVYGTKLKFMHKLVVLVSLAVLFGGCKTVLEPVILGSVEAILSTDKAKYKVGEEIKMTLTVRNVTDETIVLNFNDGQIYDFTVRKLTDRSEVWRWSTGRAFTLALWSLVLVPGAEASYLEIWNQEDNTHSQIPPGTYQLEANLSCEPEIFTEPIQVEIFGQNFETIDKGVFSSFTERTELVIKNKEKWAQVWHAHTKNISPPPQLPAVDFTSLMVIAVFRGEFTSGGYTTEITKVATLNDMIKVTVVETDQTSGAVLDVLTQPYHIIKLEKSDLPVQFIYIKDQ